MKTKKEFIPMRVLHKPLMVLLGLTLLGCAQDFGDVGDPVDLELDRTLSCSETDAEFFSRAVWPTLAGTCSSCHAASQVGSDGPALVLSSSEADAYQDVRQYIAEHGDTFVRKPTLNGAGHDGGRLLEVDSDQADDFLEMVQRVTQPIEACEDEGVVARELGFDDVVNISASRTVRKSAILMQGRMPTSEEVTTAQQSDVGLRTVLRSYLNGPVFESWLKNSANDRLLTRKYFTGQTEAQEALAADWYLYPGLFDRTGAAFDAAEAAELSCVSGGGQPAQDASEPACQVAWQKRQLANVTYTETQRAIAEEPLELIRYVVTQDRPYSEILTANYRMMNPFTYEIFDGESWTSAYDRFNAEDWRPGQLRRYQVAWNQTIQSAGYDAVPAAGLLSSPVFLLRYPSTDTNRNRARSRWTYYYFLGVDIERLAVRAMDAEELKNVTNPGAEGTSCFGCHQLLDPVAGAFQSWGNDSQFLARNGQDSLPSVYVAGDEYHDGDQWYREQLAPGFNGVDLPVSAPFGPVSGYNDGLQWLGEQLVADPRFATGTAKFWFPGVFGREPLLAPSEPSDADYAARLQAYQDEQALIATWGENFIASGFDLKTLLVDMMMSPLYRGEQLTTADSHRQQVLSDLGLGRLLSPEQLDRKLTAVLDVDWKRDWQNDGQLLEDYYMFYGGIDSDGITERPEAMNSLMYSVVDRMANELACEVVLQEFWPGMPRVLFTDVTMDTDPTTEAGEASIRQTINNLLWRLWGVSDAEEQEALWQLYKAIYDQRIAWREDDDSNGGTYVSDFLGYSVQWDDYRDDEQLDENCEVRDYDSNDGVDVSLNWDGIVWQDPENVRAHLGSYYNPQQSLRPWVAVLTVMLTDIQFVTE
ncbi:hypothetical protein MED297_05434 [Reinekea sp. MED297]|uniref:Cytochrome c domain-containing protein n=2 Tax=Reinekea TaxID=230494 RepID=A4BKH0_9GAMM|nr:hypothetical protein MED297_05434 [Reinekea sp. MED297] [Reinekea blandensis MED297]